jgi:uncharacterized metal-binding protein
MPSGQTHDRITIWSLPLVASVSFWQTRNGNLTLLVAAGFMLGGLMFGPDLDIYSRQYQRWGWFRWIWLPYQKKLRHRSFFSHGPLIGTTLRVVYFAVVVGIAGIIVAIIAEKLGNLALNWEVVGDSVRRNLSIYSQEFFALFLGLELGAMSHYVSDWTGSAYKRFKKQGVSGIFPSRKSKKGKRKSNSSSSTSASKKPIKQVTRRRKP